MKTIDLTMEISEKTPVFPGDPAQEITQCATIEKNGWNEKRMAFNSHFGTHIDAPFHMQADGKKLDEFSIESFVGNAIVVDARGQKEIVADLGNVKENDFVFFCTNHTKKAHSKEFFENNPVIPLQTAQELVDKKVSVVGIDSYTPDNEPFETHKLLFKHNIRIVENLVGLEELIGKRFECFVLPLKIADADGAPCRVVARV